MSEILEHIPPPDALWRPSDIAELDSLVSSLVDEKLKLNSYWRSAFNIARLDEYMTEISSNFSEVLTRKQFKEIQSVPLNSWIDPSVLYIGSHISVFKSYFLSWDIPGNWLFMNQPCIRTRNANAVFDDNSVSRWWSYFPSLWAISRPWRLIETCEDTFEFLVSWLRIPMENILLRANSKDKDIVAAISANQVAYPVWVEFDTKDEKYYTHKLWLWSITWRNFNIALRHWDSTEFRDIWNIIIIEDESKVYAIEIAIWATVLLSELYWLDNINTTSKISRVIPQDFGLFPKLKDCIVSSVVIMREWEAPVATNRGRVLRKYLRWLIYLRVKLWYSIWEVIHFVDEYEFQEFWIRNNVSVLVEDYMKNYEAELLQKKDLSQEDMIIKSILY